MQCLNVTINGIKIACCAREKKEIEIEGERKRKGDRERERNHVVLSESIV